MSVTRPDFGEKKTNPALLWGGIGGGVVVLGAVLYFVFGSKDEPGPPATPEKPAAAVFDAAAKVSALSRAYPPAEADGAWSLQAQLDAAAAEWESQKAPAPAVVELREAAKKYRDETLKLAPDHAEARALRGEVKYLNELEAFVSVPWIPEFERDAVRKAHLAILRDASAGWVKKKEMDERVRPLLAKYEGEKKKRDDLMASPFGQEAQKLLDGTLADLHKLFEDKVKFQGFIEKPYVVFVEENTSWNPSHAAKACVDPLLELEETFFEQFKAFGLTRIDQPVPVLFFRSRDTYVDYGVRKKEPVGPQVLAYFEWLSKRLVLHDECDFTTRLHEGTHQLFSAYAKQPDSAGDVVAQFQKQSYWFQEGIAEWFGGATRINAGGKWKYEVGMLQPDRLLQTLDTEMGRKSRFRLRDLLNLTYRSRTGILPHQHFLVYAQGWLLVYFCNHYDVDAQGRVLFGKRGRYADGWDKYLRAELEGRTGRQVFMECLGLDDAGLKKMDEEFAAYGEWVIYKLRNLHVKDKRLVPYDQYENHKGQKTGEPEDDLLDQPKRLEEETKRKAAEDK
jgi:hypothetical protein